MSKIEELIVKRYLWIEKQSPASLFAIHTIARYKSGRTVINTYYSENEVPYTIRDYMNINNLKEAKEIKGTEGVFNIRMTTYREE